MKTFGLGKGMVALAFLLGASSAFALESKRTCEPSERNGWLVVSESCPIGDGLWGRKPASQEGEFWVQCGLLNKWPQAWFAARLESGLPETTFVLREEGSQYRCLMGPFNSYGAAVAERDKLRKLPDMKSAFIRSVSAASVAMMPAKPSRVEKQKTSMKKAPKQTSGQVIRTGRLYENVATLKSPLPRVDETSYSSQGKIWWRASFKEASTTCQRDGMALASETTMKRIAATPTLTEELPNRLPFWVAEQRGYDIAMGVSMPLSEESALLVLCE